MFFRSWLGAIFAAALVYAAGVTDHGTISWALRALGILVTVLGAWWVHAAARKAVTPQTPDQPTALALAQAQTAVALMAPPDTSALTDVCHAARSLQHAVAGLREQAGTQQVQVRELWTLTGRVNDLLTDLHTATDSQLTDLGRTRTLAREVLSSAEEISGQVEEVTHGATKRKAAVGRVEQGLQDISAGMAQIQQAVDASAATIAELNKHSAQIGEIVRMIRAIAEQTNMLSLNAAIEASRAGAAGRGFAVVADEVRKLADRSRAATRQIEELVGAIRTGTAAATDAMNTGQSKVAGGAATVAAARDAIAEIVAATGQLDATVEGFGSQASSTTRRMGELLQAVEEVAKLAAQNTDTMKQLAEADWFSKAIKAAEQTADHLAQELARLDTDAEALARKAAAVQ